MNFYEMARKVDSKAAFLLFLEALAEEAAEAEVAPERTADGKLNLSPQGWENGSISAFLSAMLPWAASNSGITGKAQVSDEASWRSLAEMLHAGKFYE